MASGAEINGQMFHNTSAKKMIEPKKEAARTEARAESRDNIHHLDDPAVVKGLTS